MMTQLPPPPTGLFRSETGWHAVELHPDRRFRLTRYNEDKPYVRTYDIYLGTGAPGEANSWVLSAETHENFHEGDVMPSSEVFILGLSDTGQPISLTIYGFTLGLSPVPDEK